MKTHILLFLRFILIENKMKTCLYFFLAVLFLAVVFACGNKGRTNENGYFSEYNGIDTTLKKTSVKFVDIQHDFGQVTEGVKVVHVYEVLNTGKADLVLFSVRPSCGCTTPKYDKKPIRPGKKGRIEVAFDSKGRSGAQRKTITVVTNTEPPNTVLFLSGEVLPAEKTN